MINLKDFDPNAASNPSNNIYGFPITEEEARLVILPVPWEVTVSYSAGTARAAEHIQKASMQVDIFDLEYPDTWKQGYYMRPTDKKILMKSDYLRKEAELYIAYIKHLLSLFLSAQFVHFFPYRKAFRNDTPPLPYSPKNPQHGMR